MLLKRNLIYLFLLILAGLLVYYPVFGHQFQLQWDDQWVVMNHYTTSGIYFQNIWAILTEYYHGQYAPFNEFFYLLLYNWCGYHPLAFHAASVCLHVINACLVYVVIKKLLLGYDRTMQYVKLKAFFTSLIFVVHPFNVEAVAWISASKILIYSFFYLLATNTYLYYLNTGKICFYIYTLLLFVCSFLGKEQAVIFPLWMLLIGWFVNRKTSLYRLFWQAFPFFLLSLCFGLVTIYSQGTYVQSESYPMWQRMVYACYSLYEYFFKLMLPYNLYYIYPFPSNVKDALPEWLLLYPALLIFSLMFLWKYIHQKVVLFCLLLFFIHIIVALHIVPLNRFAIVADRYAYVSSIGISLLLVWLCADLYKRVGRYILLIYFLYILIIGGYAHWRSKIWYDSTVLKKEILK